MKKNVTMFLVLLVCGVFLFACGKADTEYWLCGTGISDGPDYTGGICKMYFKQNAVALEDNLLKSMSREDYGEQIGTVETYDGEEREISETDNVAGIYIAITVKNGKVIEIYYSS